MVIYFDIVFLINLVMNFLILLFVGIVLNLKRNYIRIFLGAIVGCLFLLSLFFSNPILQAMPFKIALSFLMILLSFRLKDFKEFFKVLGFFYLISFMVGGGAFALFYFYNLKEAFSSNILLINNISVPWWILLVSSLVLLIFFKYLWPLIYRVLSRENLIVPIKIVFGQKSLELKALIDTGNELHDPVSDYPVIIVEFEAIKDFFNQDIQEAMRKGPEKSLEDLGRILSGSKWATRFRLIPFESIGKSKGLLIGFKPDLITVDFNDNVLEIKGAILGIYQRILSSNGTYRALLHPDLINV